MEKTGNKQGGVDEWLNVLGFFYKGRQCKDCTKYHSEIPTYGDLISNCCVPQFFKHESKAKSLN